MRGFIPLPGLQGKWINCISLHFAPAIPAQVEQRHENEFGERCSHRGICSRLYRKGSFPHPAGLHLLLHFRGRKSGQCREHRRLQRRGLAEATRPRCNATPPLSEQVKESLGEPLFVCLLWPGNKKRLLMLLVVSERETPEPTVLLPTRKHSTVFQLGAAAFRAVSSPPLNPP